MLLTSTVSVLNVALKVEAKHILDVDVGRGLILSPVCCDRLGQLGAIHVAELGTGSARDSVCDVRGERSGSMPSEVGQHSLGRGRRHLAGDSVGARFPFFPHAGPNLVRMSGAESMLVRSRGE